MSGTGRAWRILDGWQRGAATGLAIYSVIFVLASALCLAQYLGVAAEGYVGAGWLLLFFGLPLTMIEALLESFEPSFLQQIVNLFGLAFLNWIAVGALAGHWVGKAKRADT